MRRDPLGVAAVGLRTYRQFLTYKKLRWALQLNQGHFNGPTQNDIKMIRQWFGVDALDRKYESLTKRVAGCRRAVVLADCASPLDLCM